jgi:hypothetical protein
VFYDIVFHFTLLPEFPVFYFHFIFFPNKVMRRWEIAIKESEEEEEEEEGNTMRPNPEEVIDTSRKEVMI